MALFRLVSQVVPLVRQIPKSDAYVMEDSAASGGHAIPPAFFGVHLQLARLQAALVALVEAENLLSTGGGVGGPEAGEQQQQQRRFFTMKPAQVTDHRCG